MSTPGCIPGAANPSTLLSRRGSSSDPWVRRARPTFLYIMYFMILWSLPMGVISAINPLGAETMSRGIHLYLAGLPEPLYALFGTCYIGYATLRQWGKAKGSE